MSYLYTQRNGLDEPHNYMYTPFGGKEFLHAYWEDRQNVLRRIAGLVNAGGDDARELPVLGLLEAAGWDGMRFSSPSHSPPATTTGAPVACDLSVFSISSTVDTGCLLETLLAAQFGAGHGELVKVWLDRLVQRFEVTKKLYAGYLPGFRKGEGPNTSVRLYWLLALSLALFHAQTRHVKYLNTLLKVNDLLASLPPKMLSGHLSAKLMATVFQIELAGVAGLTEAGEGCHAAQ